MFVRIEKKSFGENLKPSCILQCPQNLHKDLIDDKLLVLLKFVLEGDLTWVASAHWIQSDIYYVAVSMVQQFKGQVCNKKGSWGPGKHVSTVDT